MKPGNEVEITSALFLEKPQMLPTKTLLFTLTAAITVHLHASGATINVDTIIGPNHLFGTQTISIVDGPSPPTKVEMLEGAVVGHPAERVAFDLRGRSRLTMRGGSVRALEYPVLLREESVFHMIDGEILAGEIDARATSTAIIDGGRWPRLNGFDSSTLRVTGGSSDASIVEIYEQSHAVISGGNLRFTSYDSTTALIKGGNFKSFKMEEGGDILVNGGVFSDGIIVNGGTLRIRGITGNDFVEEALVVGGGEAHIYGFGLRFDVDNEAGPIITGRLADGDSFTVPYSGQNIILHEVPEPATSGMLAVGLSVIVTARWGRRN